MPQPVMSFLDATDRVAFVAGAAGGVGKAVVDVFQDAGARVAAGARRLDQLGPPSETYLPLAVDVINEKKVNAAIDKAAAVFGRLDYVINMTGTVGKGKVVDMPLSEWQRVIKVNLTSCFLLAKAAYPHLSETKGTFIMCSSTNSLNGGREMSGAAYAASKAGVNNLNRYLAKEWAPDGIRVHTLVPGPIDTPMIHRLSDEQHAGLKTTLLIKRYVSPVEVAKGAAFLCSDAAAAMTGTLLNISSGQHLD